MTDFKVGPSVTFTGLPKPGAHTAMATVWPVGPSLRFKSPHDPPDDSGVFDLSPRLDGDAISVRTGPLNRTGFSGGARTAGLNSSGSSLEISSGDVTLDAQANAATLNGRALAVAGAVTLDANTLITPAH